MGKGIDMGGLAKDMTLRDLFACQLLGGLVVGAMDTGGPYAEILAAEAYRLADALIAKRWAAAAPSEAE